VDCTDQAVRTDIATTLRDTKRPRLKRRMSLPLLLDQVCENHFESLAKFTMCAVVLICTRVARELGTVTPLGQIFATSRHNP
jgi:hypothetical protein